MGTNFYLISHQGDDDPSFHIGKRSAAGQYCWDCGMTLCKQGENRVHLSESTWYESCPKCKGILKKSGVWDGSAGVELGFSQPDTKDKRKGVRTISSFTWAMSPDRLRLRRKVVDEYGRFQTIGEFRERVLANCPVQFFQFIGTEFS